MTDLQPAPQKKRGAPFGNTNGASKADSARRGPPPGNVNALTHGFYARRLPAAALEGLDETGTHSLKDEIEVMRVFARKVAELGANVEDLNEAKSLLHILSIATSAINRLVRTHAFIPDPTTDPGHILRQTLLELEEEWPELKELASHYPSDPHDLNDPYDQGG